MCIDRERHIEVRVMISIMILTVCGSDKEPGKCDGYGYDRWVVIKMRMIMRVIMIMMSREQVGNGEELQVCVGSDW